MTKAGFMKPDETSRNQDGLMCIMGLMMFYAEKDGINCTSIKERFLSASKGQIKRAIKWARQNQSSFSAPEDIDGLVSYLRREFISKETTI